MTGILHRQRALHSQEAPEKTCDDYLTLNVSLHGTGSDTNLMIQSYLTSIDTNSKHIKSAALNFKCSSHQTV
jgi:hypothetical protein